MREHTVDIYNDSGINFHAGRVLELAEQHGVRGTVAELLPYTVHGPGYERGVRTELSAALHRLRSNQIEQGMYHLSEAVRCVPNATRVLHRPRAPHGTEPASHPQAQAGNAADPTGAADPPEPATTHLLDVRVYDPAQSRTLASSYTTSGYQGTLAGEFRDAHHIGGSLGSTWRTGMRIAANDAVVTAIGVSDPQQVRPEHRLDDRRWLQAARQAAEAIDPRAAWVAIRTRPDAVLLLTTAARRPSEISRRVTAAAAAALRRRQVPFSRPPARGPSSTAARPPAAAEQPANRQPGSPR